MGFEELKKIRLEKSEKLTSSGRDCYPARSSFHLTPIADIRKNFSTLARSKKSHAVGGRVLALREHGGSLFCDLFDGTGRIQVFAARNVSAKEEFELFRASVDIGDFIGVSGRTFYTKKREPTIEVSAWEMLAKALRPLPEKWHGLQDIEERFRKRYLDLLMNPEVRERFVFRSRLVRELRGLLDRQGYIELETPILQPLYGGALAEPFKTHHRMLDMDLYLRIAPELYLKRLLVAGFPKVYEIGKNFRNEGIDATHNPEFTTIELYEAYINAEHLRDFIVAILSNLIRKVLRRSVFSYQGQNITFPKRVPSIPFWSVIERHALIMHPEKASREEFALKAKQFGLAPEKHDAKEKIADEIFKKVCLPRLIQPTFVVNYPIGTSPLAKALPGSAELADRFQLVMGGREFVHGFSELNDPLEQRNRFLKQEEFRREADREAHPLDEDFVEALEYGMPPAAGLAISIDRLAMLLTDTHNIKEVILFPTLRPKE